MAAAATSEKEKREIFMAEKTAKESAAESSTAMQRYTKYERARMIGARALQISMGAPFLIKLEEEDLKRFRYNPIEIAKLEFEKSVIPITVKRALSSKQ